MKLSLNCDYLNERYQAVLSCGTVYYAVQGGFKFWVCGWNPYVPAFKWKLISGTFLQLCYRAIQVRSNFENKKATEQYLYVVIFIFYLDGLVIWPRHNFPIIKLDTEYSCIMTPKSRESINLSIKIQENLTLFKQLVWTQVIKSTVSLVLWSMTSQIRLDYTWPLTRKWN